MTLPPVTKRLQGWRHRGWRVCGYFGWVRLVLIGLLCVAIGVPAFLWTTSSPDMLSIATVHTEQISFDVLDGRKAAFSVTGMKMAELGSDKTVCVRGLFTPGPGTKVAYGRVGTGPVEITVTPAPGAKGAAVGLLDPGDGTRPQRYSEPLAMQQESTCPGGADATKGLRFPIWGETQVGHEFRPAVEGGAPEPSLLIDGTIDVSAHAVWTHSLYRVRSVTLPVASRLEAADESHGGRTGGTIWWGVASADPDKTALTVNVATEAPVLALYRPYRTEAEVISVSSLRQLTDDPTLIRIQIYGAVFTTLVTLFAGIAEHELLGKKHPENPPS